jgi:hypothetical protein
VLLLRPSMFLRHLENPLQPDTPVNRVQMRGVGWFFCLFTLLMISGSIEKLEGFNRNILIALWVSPIIIPILLWILWRYSPLQQISRRHLIDESFEDQAWEIRMTLTFSGLLSLIVVTALFLAARGHHP